jgi:hypothetical protein
LLGRKRSDVQRLKASANDSREKQSANEVDVGNEAEEALLCLLSRQAGNGQEFRGE